MAYGFIVKKGIVRIVSVLCDGLHSPPRITLSSLTFPKFSTKAMPLERLLSEAFHFLKFGESRDPLPNSPPAKKAE